MTRHNTTPTHLTDREREDLALAVHYATRCNCDSGEGDRMVADELTPAVERILAARGNNTAHEQAVQRVQALADEWLNSGDDRRYVHDLGRALRAALSPAPTNESWFREEYARAKERNDQTPPRARMIVTNPELSAHHPAPTNEELDCPCEACRG